jgi:hypothetical protein
MNLSDHFTWSRWELRRDVSWLTDKRSGRVAASHHRPLFGCLQRLLAQLAGRQAPCKRFKPGVLGVQHSHHLLTGHTKCHTKYQNNTRPNLSKKLSYQSRRACASNTVALGIGLLC